MRFMGKVVGFYTKGKGKKHKHIPITKSDRRWKYNGYSSGGKFPQRHKEELGIFLKGASQGGHDWTYDEIDDLIEKGELLKTFNDDNAGQTTYLAKVPRYGYIVAIKREEGIDTVQSFGQNEKLASKTFTKEKNNPGPFYEENI